MDEIQPLVSKAASCLSKGFVEDAYYTYFEVLDTALKNLRNIVFHDNAIIKKPPVSGLLLDTCIKSLHEVQEILEKNVAQKPAIPPKPLRVSMHLSESQDNKQSSSDVSHSDFLPKRKPLPPRPVVIPTTTSAKPSPLHIDIPKIPRAHFIDLYDDSDAGRSPVSPQLSMSPPDSPNLRIFDTSPLSIQTNMSIPQQSYINIVPEGCVDPSVLVLPPLEENGASEYAPHIPKSPLITSFGTLSEKLQNANDMMIEMGTSNKGAEEYSDDNAEAAQRLCSTISTTQATLGQVNSLMQLAATTNSITSFSPYLVAYQLTLIESALFQRIPAEALLTHSPRTPHPSIVASTDFFNYLTRIIEVSILSSPEASHRAQTLNYWAKIATRLYELNNFQTLKAVLSATGTPPIQRLKRTWACIPKKTLTRLETLSDLMSEKDNYGRYRETMINGNTLKKQGIENRLIVPVTKPTVPFLGVFIMDITYLLAAVKKSGSVTSPISPASTPTSSFPSYLHPDHKISLVEDPRVQELLRVLRCYLAGPKYPTTPLPGYLKSKSKLFSFGTSSESVSNSWEKMYILRRKKESNEENLNTIQQVITHYILTRTWIPERQVDELSLRREPKKLTTEKSSDRIGSTTSQHSALSSSSSSNPGSIEEDMYVDKQNNNGIRDTLGNIKQHLHLSLGSRYSESDINYNSKRSSFSFRQKGRHSVGASAPEVLFSPKTLTSLDDANAFKLTESPTTVPESPMSSRFPPSTKPTPENRFTNHNSTIPMPRGSEATPFSYVNQESLVEAIKRRNQRTEEGGFLIRNEIQSRKGNVKDAFIPLAETRSQVSPQITEKMKRFSQVHY
ncbi:hypothetical protein K7432_004632 [Basidiobolus ranarum]|uniref:Ras-GEF domain-containing protein n=1 Tax=Basidiobolus ranarum TaxID=34480 RepID=A0ABR2W4U9_9FUNG